MSENVSEAKQSIQNYARTIAYNVYEESLILFLNYFLYFETPLSPNFGSLSILYVLSPLKNERFCQTPLERQIVHLSTLSAAPT